MRTCASTRLGPSDLPRPLKEYAALLDSDSGAAGRGRRLASGIAGDDGGPGEITPVEGKQNLEASRVLSVRLVPKGERVEKEPPYPFPTRLFSDGVVAKSIFVSGPAPELKLGWKNDETLWIKVNREGAIHRAAEGVLVRGGIQRRVAVEYPL